MQQVLSMKQVAHFNQMQMRIKNFLWGIILLSGIFLGGAFAYAQQQGIDTGCTGPELGECGDGIDNDGDGTADRCGAYSSDGRYLPPDPMCIPTDAKTKTETPEKSTGSKIIPCSDKCTFKDVFELLNNVISFFFTAILIPIVFIVLIYTGFKYIKAQGKPGMLATLGNTFKNLALGIVIILCAWLVVRTILVMVISGDFGDVLMFFE